MFVATDEYINKICPFNISPTREEMDYFNDMSIPAIYDGRYIHASEINNVPEIEIYSYENELSNI